MGIPSTLIDALTQRAWQKRLASFIISGLLGLSLWGCTNGAQSVRLVELPDIPTGSEVRRLNGAVSEVAPPAVLLDLATLSAQYQPQVEITAPKANQVIETDKLEVQLNVKGLSIYKDEALALGPHLQVILDNQPAQSVYSLQDSLTLSNLTPGSHTLQVVAVKPWGESFKNEAAYAQTTFHVFAKTGENIPNPEQPLLTYLEPQGTYGAEPILLDFYLNNAPLHQLAQASNSDDIVDWQIRCTVNGQSFVLDQWQPIYLQGLTPGQNWVQLTLIDETGNPIENAFNSTIRTLTYDPSQRNNLSKIIRGELSLEKVGQIVDARYEPPAAIVETPSPSPEETFGGDNSAESNAPVEETELVESPETRLKVDPSASTAEQNAATLEDTLIDTANDVAEDDVTEDDVTEDDVTEDDVTEDEITTDERPEKEARDGEAAPLLEQTEQTRQTFDSKEISPNRRRQDGVSQAEEDKGAEETKQVKQSTNSLSTNEEKNTDKRSLFQKFSQIFESSNKSNDAPLLDGQAEQIEIPSPEALTTEEAIADELAKETLNQEPETAIETTDATAVESIESTPTEKDEDSKRLESQTQESQTQASQTQESQALDSREPLIPAPLAAEELTTEQGTTTKELTTEELSSERENATPTPSNDIELPSETDNSFFSRWSDKVTNFFQQPASSRPSTKSSGPISIEELPVILDNQIETDSAIESTDSQDILDALELDTLELDTLENDRADSAAGINSDALIETEIEAETDMTNLEAEIDFETETELETDFETDPVESIIIPETLSAPSSPSENVMAPLTE